MPADLHVWAVPLRTRFRGLTVRDGVLVRGDAGWGEFSPFWDYDVARVRSRGGAPRARRPTWAGPAPVRDADPGQRHRPRGRRRAPRTASCASPAAAGPPRSRSPSRGSRSPTRSPASRRCGTRSGPTGAIRVDANAAWDVDTAVARLFALDRAAGGLEYAEQPVPTVDDLAAAAPAHARADRRRRVDPSRRGPAAPSRARTPPTSSCSRCSRSAACARAWSSPSAIGLPVVVSSAPSSRRSGSRPGSRSRPRCPSCPYACGLATAQLFTADLVADPLLPVDGAIAVRRPEPDPGAARRRGRADELADRWRRAARRRRGSGMMAGVTTTAPRSRPGDDGSPGARPGARRPGRRGRGARPRLPQRTARVRARGRRPARRPAPAGAPRAAPARAGRRAVGRVRRRSVSCARPRIGPDGQRTSRRARSPSSPPRAPPSPTCTRPSSRRTTAACRSSLLTADRPHELRGTGANQTTDQVGIFGRRRPARPRRPGPRRASRRGARPAPDRRARASRPRRVRAPATPGPVHLEPRVPRAARARAARRGPSRPPSGLTHVQARPVAGGRHRRRRAVDAAARRAAAGRRPSSSPGTAPGRSRAGSPRRTAGRCSRSRRPAPAAARTRSRPTGSCSRTRCSAAPCGASSSLGRPTLSRPCSGCSRGRTSRSSSSRPRGADWPDAARNASEVLLDPPARMRNGRMRAPAGLARGVADRRQGRGRGRSTGCSTRLDARPRSRSGTRVTGPALARAVAQVSARRRRRWWSARRTPCATWTWWPAGTAPPVVARQPRARGHRRHRLAPRSASRSGCRTVASARCSATSRSCTTSAGCCAARSSRRRTCSSSSPTTTAARSSRRSNRGEPERADVFERVFGTPHGADIAALCAGYGVRHTRVGDVDGLLPALAAPGTGAERRGGPRRPDRPPRARRAARRARSPRRSRTRCQD